MFFSCPSSARLVLADRLPSPSPTHDDPPESHRSHDDPPESRRPPHDESDNSDEFMMILQSLAFSFPPTTPPSTPPPTPPPPPPPPAPSLLTQHLRRICPATLPLRIAFARPRIAEWPRRDSGRSPGPGRSSGRTPPTPGRPPMLPRGGSRWGSMAAYHDATSATADFSLFDNPGLPDHSHHTSPHLDDEGPDYTSCAHVKQFNVLNSGLRNHLPFEL